MRIDQDDLGESDEERERAYEPNEVPTRFRAQIGADQDDRRLNYGTSMRR